MKIYAKLIAGIWETYLRIENGGALFEWVVSSVEVNRRITARITKKRAKETPVPLQLPNPDYDPEDPESPEFIPETQDQMTERRATETADMIAAEIDKMEGVEEKEDNNYPSHARLRTLGWKLVLDTSYDPATQTLGGYELSTDGNNVVQKVIDLTPEDMAEKAQDKWLSDMALSDKTMTRDIEDIWDVIGIGNAPDSTKQKHAAKKVLRGQKP